LTGAPGAALKCLIGIRTGLAVGVLAAPRLSARLFGMDPVAQPAMTYLARLFGIRNGALAFGLARLDTQRDPRAFVALNVGIDLADAAAGLLAARRRELSARTTALVVGTALVAAALGVTARTQVATRELAGAAERG
jgi:hypothetical protein